MATIPNGAGWVRAALLLPILVGLSACGSSVQTADDYNECVLRGIAVADSSSEATRIRQRCQELYPGSVQQQRARELPPAALGKVQLDAEIEFGEYLNGTAYNGNADLRVTEITVSVEVGTPGNSDTQLYTEQVNLNPLTRGDFGVLMDSKQPILNWRVVSARGIAE